MERLAALPRGGRLVAHAVTLESEGLLVAAHARLAEAGWDVELTRVGTHGLLFHWTGASAEKPIVLMAHLDVVPVDAEAPWQHDAFGGEIHDSDEGPAIWGRGTLDDKGLSLIHI